MKPRSSDSAKSEINEWVTFIAVVGIVLFVGLKIWSSLGLTNINVYPKANVGVQNIRQIGMVLFMYATDHNGTYPDGKTSTEVFQKLIDEKYVNDSTIFYMPMPGKTKPTSSKLTADNVCYDVTSGVTDKSSDSIPVVFSTGYTITYSRGADAKVDSSAHHAFQGIAVCFKSNAAWFKKIEFNNTVPGFIAVDFDPGATTYRQLKP